MPKSLMKVDVPQEHFEAVKHRFIDIVRRRTDEFNKYKSIVEQMEELAFDCYTQGLLDGEQIGRKAANGG